jgi:hypothetical protein
LAGGSQVRVGYNVWHGAKDGPVLALVSTLHGWEPIGAEIIRRVLNETDPSELSGTVVAIPIANPQALEFGGTVESAGLQVSPVDQLNLNRSFPGTGRHSSMPTPTLARTIFEELSKYSDVVLDFHDGTSSNNMIPLCTFPAYEAELGYSETLSERALKLAKAMGAQVGRRRPGTAPNSGTLTAACGAEDIVGLVLSVGGLGLVNEELDEGIRCVRNLMKAMGMIDGEPELPAYQLIVSGANHRVLFTSEGGFFLSPDDVELGAFVKKGQVLGRVIDPVTSEVRETMKAPFDGVIGMFREKLATNPGGMVGHVASTENMFWSTGELP